MEYVIIPKQMLDRMDEHLSFAAQEYDYRLDDKHEDDETLSSLEASMRDLGELQRDLGRLDTLSEQAYLVLCGLVAPNDVVDSEGIYSDRWDELRRVFPAAEFLKGYCTVDWSKGDPEDPNNYYDAGDTESD